MMHRLSSLLAALIVVAVLRQALLPIAAQAERTLAGDVNCDGVSNSIDAALILQWDARLVSSLPCFDNGDIGHNLYGEDVWENDFVDSLDALVILQREAGLMGHCTGDTNGSADGLVAELVVGPNRTTFAAGEPIALTFAITNCASEAITRGYGKPLFDDFIVQDTEGLTVWRWSSGLLVPAVISERTFQPGETVIHAERWDQTDGVGHPVSTATYRIWGLDVSCPYDQRPAGCDLAASVQIEIVP